jgi:glutamine amidotransferase
MCRLFGFRSVIQSQVHSSLVTGEQSFMHLSHDHPDGWGVAYYIEDAPHVVKSESTAINDQLFQRVSGIVASNTVIAHLRKATQGQVTIVNTHPFQYGRWVFAHNGHIKEFSRYRQMLWDRLKLPFRRFLIGETDSELLFFWILQFVAEEVPLKSSQVPIDILIRAARRALAELMAITGEFAAEDGPPSETYLTFLLTNGETMLAHHGGKRLFFSTYKNRCPERESCPHFATVCENPSIQGALNHLVISSEPIYGENIWQALRPGDLLGVDHTMQLAWGRSR